MKQPVIQFENFTFQYNSQVAPTLKNINLTIYKGEKICIVGPSGSGKSTLVHCLNGLVPFAYKGKSTGRLLLDGKETKTLDLFTIAKTIGSVLQDTDGQFIGLTVGEDIAFALENDRVDVNTMHRRVYNAARQVQMETYLNHHIQELSGGQKQRVGLAGVLVNEIDVLLFDEPLANLDPATGRYAMKLIEELHQNEGKTVIIVEHRLEDVLTQPVDRIILINHGEIIADLTPDDMLKSKYLEDNWIREPLYIRALKYAGCSLEHISNMQNLDAIITKDLANALQQWANTIQLKKSNHTTSRNQTVIELRDVTFNYPNQNPIIMGISLKLFAGEMVCLVGANGAGKSTLSKLICKFENLTSGSIYFQKEDAGQDTIKKRAQRVGFVLQNPNQMFSKQVVIEEVMFGLLQRQIPEEKAKKKAEDVLKICGLYPLRNWPISALSYGQKKRLSIAAILVLNPSIIILDEPTAGQDYKHTTELMDFLRELQKKEITILLITHDMHLMMDYTDRAIVLSNGEIIADDTPAHILTNHTIMDKANLTASSLLQLAEQLGYQKPDEFVERFIQYEREVRSHKYEIIKLP